MHKLIRSILFTLIAAIPALSLITGCSAPCDYPDQRGVIVRIINAMPDMPMITVFINGKIIVQNFPYDPPSTNLYLNSYLDGSPISAGDSSVFVVTSDAAGTDTVAKGKVVLNFDRQTVVISGRGHRKPPMKPAIFIRLDDQSDEASATQTLIRFVNAVPDLDSLDIYFKGDTVGKPLGKKDLTIRYGEVQPHMILNSVAGLTITEAGNPNNVIFSIGYPFAFPGFFITAIVRGASKPIGTEFTAAPLVLSDASLGNFIFNFKTFFVRLVDATRSQQMSLLIRSTYITLNGENTGPPRGNYPNQDKVTNIAAGTISQYMPLNILNDSIAEYWISKTPDPKDTVASSIDHAQANIRFSKIAVEEDILNSATPVYSYLNLPDTMTNPAGNFGRVRLINLSPDHKSMNITINGITTVINWKEVKFFDVGLSDTSIKLQDGSASKTYTMPVSGIAPISVYILPDSSPGELPIATSSD